MDHWLLPRGVIEHVCGQNWGEITPTLLWTNSVMVEANRVDKFEGI